MHPCRSNPCPLFLVGRSVLAGMVLSGTSACQEAPSGGKYVTTWLVERSDRAAFPTTELVDASGHLDIPADLLPAAETVVPVDRLSWRTGFSPVQTTVLETGSALDRSSLPPPVGSGDPDGVVLIDLTAEHRIPALVELDAWPDNPEHPRLLVRPLEPMVPGHEVAVSVSAALRTTDGSAYTGPDWFRSAQRGATIRGGTAGHYADLSNRLVELGLPTPVLAVDFPIGDGRAPLLSVVEELPTPDTWQWNQVFDSSAGDPLPEGTWIQARGSFTTTSWLEDDAVFVAGPDGRPVRQGEVEADLFLFIPDTVQDAAPGSVPVWLFGHGIFSHPRDYLADDDDPSGVITLARAAGAILLGTEWRGLTRDDIAVAARVGGDFGRIPELTDKLVQGVADNIALAKLIAEGNLLEDAIFAGKANPNALRYYGISLGGIEGATMFAVDDTISHGVFHVGGASWSTMLERSSNWTQFEILMADAIPSPGDRQVLYAASQLFWDAADPAIYATSLSRRSVLWQGSVGDEQVPNLTTDLIAAAAGATLLGPSPRTPDGFSETTGPITGPAVSWFDPEVGHPPLENRPAEVTGAHSIPRLWPGQHRQTIQFLDPQTPGLVVHPCGSDPCTARNPG